MRTYNLRHKAELLEELRILGMKKKRLEDQFKIDMTDITADASVIKAELEILRTLGEDKLLGDS